MEPTTEEKGKKKSCVVQPKAKAETETERNSRKREKNNTINVLQVSSRINTEVLYLCFPNTFCIGYFFFSFFFFIYLPPVTFFSTAFSVTYIPRPPRYFLTVHFQLHKVLSASPSFQSACLRFCWFVHQIICLSCQCIFRFAHLLTSLSVFSICLSVFPAVCTPTYLSHFQILSSRLGFF